METYGDASARRPALSDDKHQLKLTSSDRALKIGSFLTLLPNPLFAEVDKPAMSAEYIG